MPSQKFNTTVSGKPETAAEIAESIASGELPPYIGLISGVVIMLFNVIAAGIGITIRRDRQHEEELRRWAADNALLASANERTRIAREMHDVVAHSLASINVQAGVALHLMDEQPGQSRSALQAIKQASNDALGELRSVLDVLRQNRQIRLHGGG